MRRHAKTPRAKLVKKCDDLLSLYIRSRDDCVTCEFRHQQRRSDMTNGHLFSRSNYSTRWDLINCAGQCKGCNGLHEHDSSHYTKWFLEKYGNAVWDELYARHHLTRQFKTFELEELAVDLKLLLDRKISEKDYQLKWSFVVVD